MHRPEKNANGIALMVVLWVLVLLSALATEFAYSMRTEVNTTKNFKEDIESYHLAKAGINLAMAELLKAARFHSIHPQYGFIVGNPKEKKDNKKNPAAQEVDETPDFYIMQREDIPLGHGTFSYKITDENGRINVNRAPRELLVKVLGLAGVQTGEERDIIADSILDWIDADDIHRINGAEYDYYAAQSLGYAPKNDFFESMDELLKVRGITADLLYGTPPERLAGAKIFYTGLVKFLTVQDVGYVNPNTASMEVLSTIYTEAQTAEILNARAGKGYYNDSVSSHFRLEATGRINDSHARHTITAIIQKFGFGADATLLIRYWNDNVTEI